MTDPSYKGQILCFTQPLIGNYGVPSSTARDELNLMKYMESPTVQCIGIVVAEVAMEHSHWTAVVPEIRDKGSSLAKITVGKEYDADEDAAFEDPGAVNLVQRVTTKELFYVSCPVKYSKGYHVAVLDCEAKENILRCLVQRGALLRVFPYNYPIDKFANKFDGVFISNVPGDPTHCSKTVINLRSTIKNNTDLPIFGIYSGHQLLVLAAGAKTIKLKYGNRAHNIPALDLQSGQCHITSQNHGYAVHAETSPKEWFPYFTNLNDLSNEGIQHVTLPIFSTQFHPKAKGGPLDTAFLFDKFFDNIRAYKAKNGLEQFKIKNSLLVDILPTERVL
ncbi:small subunit of carbamoyl phosphate synthase [Metschnikowia bicuspidata]|uniref:carbamoyl-phosphate synthase (glutamine-hydrolyzing) n=1 Tax=Metschnikowia bicuspidata TaxID=27322 RepID=A0A4P9ZF69_9ASCO|nr:small subunit of carbamoyl phosphate synthase [Metschnikowia bicuspidata]